MTRADYDLTGIGNAIVDVIAHADDAFLAAHGIEKGSMTLIDAARAEELYAHMGAGIQASGGSAANTMAGFAALGGRGAYIGKVADDPLGTFFRHDIRSVGVHFGSTVLTGGAPTARCMIVVTPDAQRSMSTYLGACVELGEADVDEAVIAGSSVTYMEGYLFDRPEAKAAFRKAAAVAHAAARQVSLTLSDSFCVGRHHADFLDLVENHADILFANESEITALYKTDDFTTAVQAVQALGKTAAITCGASGAVIVVKGEVTEVPAEPAGRIVDTTGAGDLFAAGFLYGWTRSQSAAVCGRLGCLAAGEIISHVGARPETDLAALVRSKGL
jgi:sugar/nucleoside kinase (ribokinase family)